VGTISLNGKKRKNKFCEITKLTEVMEMNLRCESENMRKHSWTGIHLFYLKSLIVEFLKIITFHAYFDS
jgi:hypothetical protein